MTTTSLPNFIYVTAVLYEIDRVTYFTFVSSLSFSSFSFSFSSTRRDFIYKPILTNEVPLDLSRSGIVPFSPYIFCDFLHFLTNREKVLPNDPGGFSFHPIFQKAMSFDEGLLGNKVLLYMFFG